MGFFSLFTMGLGYIIGSGIFAILPIVMGNAGKSVSLACLAGALLCLFSASIPAVFMSSTIDLPGGVYSQGAVLMPEALAGTYGILNAIGQMTFSGSLISLTGYVVQMIPGLSDLQKLVSFVLLVCFFLLGLKGVKLSAGFQNVTVIVLVLALATFIVGGLPHVNFGTYFSDNYFSGGMDGFMQASAMLMFCSIGGTAVLSFSSEAKNSKRDIPLATLLSSLTVAVLYFFIAVVGSGILPVEDVAAAMNLGIVAETFLPTPLYLFFMVGGAMFGLGTTVNSQLAALPYPVLKMAEDGWLPKSCTKRDKHFNYPYIIMGFMFVVGGVLPIVFGLNITDIASMAGAPTFLFSGVLALYSMQIPKKFPERWKQSKFHVPNPVLYALMILSAAASFFLTYTMLQMNGLTTALIILALVAVLVAYCYWRTKSGKVDLSYISALIEENK